MFKEVVDKWGTVDVLVNNAVGAPRGACDACGRSAWDCCL